MLKLKDVWRRYRTEEVETSALNGVSLEIVAKEFVTVMGPSGCGKSTLLNILGLLDSPDDGAYWFFGEDVSKHSERELTLLRRAKIGFIFQGFNLINDLNVSENVEVPLLYRRVPGTERRQRVAAALERMGIAHRGKHLPNQLSGGQQQRVAIARALVADPTLILADEPTGNLDTENGTAVMELLKQINEAGTTVVVVTHSLVHAAYAKRTLNLLDGQVVSEALLAA